MAQVGQNFTVYEENTATLEVQFLDPVGLPLNLLGMTITWEMGELNYPPVATKSSDDVTQINIIDRVAGIVHIYLTKDDTNLPEDLGSDRIVYHHEASTTTADGLVETVMTGTATIIRSFA